MCPVARCRRGLRRDLSGSALPTLPQSVSRGARLSRLPWFAFATACQVARPPGRIGPSFPGPPGAFTSRLPTGRSPFPPLDMTTTATGLLCWRDFHPQEWQLASLHRTQTANPSRLPLRMERPQARVLSWVDWNRGCRKVFGVEPAGGICASEPEVPMILNALVEKLKRRSKDDFKGRHFEA